MNVVKYVVGDAFGYLNENLKQKVLGFGMASWYTSAEDAQAAKMRNLHLCGADAIVTKITVIE